MTVASTDGLAQGQSISGTGIAAGTTIQAINPSGSIITLSQNATSTATNTLTLTNIGVSSEDLTLLGIAQGSIDAVLNFTGTYAGAALGNEREQSAN